MTVVTLVSRLFTDPPNDALEACLVEDSAHIFTGAQGTHVACIQIALSLLSDGDTFLVIDGIFGDDTADAVFDYKDARQILGPGQVTPDKIVGKRTLQSLDDEMSIFEEQSVANDELVSSTVLGSPHDHSTCPFSNFPSPGSGGRVSHFGLPVNPLPGRSINLGGEGEAAYLGFEDFLPSPQIGPPRPFTSSLADHSVQNICMRDAPIGMNGSVDAGRDEILRIAAAGCRFTFCGDVPEFRDALNSLGQADHDFFLTDPRFSNPPPTKPAEVLVITIA